MKKIRYIITAVLLTMVSASCSFTADAASLNGTEGSSALEESEFYQKLSGLEGVSSVQKIEQTEEVFPEKYIVTFTQPLDWDDPDAGTFEQRVEIGYIGDDNINCYYVGGYCLRDKVEGQENALTLDDQSELSKLLDGNFISIEYRFFGDSAPQGLSNDSTDLWEYLTVENAAKDFKSIIEKLGTILPGKKTFSGRSKGGFTTNTMACFYPDLCDAYVAYVAPLCDGTNDPSFSENIYETIGDLAYPSDEAAALRQKMLDFQVFCIENRDELQDMFWKAAMEKGRTFRDFATKEILYDVTIFDFGVTYWQYGQDFGELDKILAMPDGTDEEHTAVLNAVYELITPITSFDTWSTDFLSFPYLVQVEKQMGNYLMDFSYLREAVIEKTGKDMLAVTEEMQFDLCKNIFFTEEQKEAFQYDDSLRKEMISWSQTTDAHVIMIYGNCDVWYASRIPDTDNPNIHIFVQNGGCHRSDIEGLSEEDNNVCIDLLTEWTD